MNLFSPRVIAQGTVVCLASALWYAGSSFSQSLTPSYRLSRPCSRIRDALLRAAPSENAAADTLRLLAIRVEFKPDTLDTTTGTGRFDLSTSGAPKIDPPPHHRAYFTAQLNALARYYLVASRGRLVLQAEVFPGDDSAAYQVARDMSYYSPGKKSPLADQRLAQLLQDALQAAEQADVIDFSSFDSFVIFHAGVGNDFKLDFDPTPNDVPSAFLTLEDLRAALGNNDPGYQGVAVQGGSFHVPDGIILPETQSQEGVEFGLLGTTALMFGHQIGLPDLFDTRTGLAGIGRWGLMDQGSGNFQGLLPALPSAWERVFLGWEQPYVVTGAEKLPVAAFDANSSEPRIYKIPIADDEYFLLENRHTDVNRDNVAIGYDAGGRRVEFKFDGFGNPQLLSDAPIGVITRVDEYDFGLPGSGVLIWHIDEEIIRQNYAANRVNADRDRRGVDLEEADGAQDIGRVYGFLDPGAGAENGAAEDAWWKSNPVITQYLRPGQPVTFGPATQPSTAANSGAGTGIVITQFSESQPVMSFSVRNVFAVPNFPQYAGGGVGVFSPLLADLTADGHLDVVIATSLGDIYAWQFDGRKVITNVDSVSVPQPNGRTLRLPAARFATTGDSLYQPPALADLNGDGRAEVLAAGKDGMLRAWQAVDQNLDGRADLLWQAGLDAPSRANIVVALSRQMVFCATGTDKLCAFTTEGTLLWQRPLRSPARGISLVDADHILVTLRDNIALFSVEGNEVTSGVKGDMQLRDLSGAAAIADMENDGEIEVVVRDRRGSFSLSSLVAEDKPGFPVSTTAPGAGNVALGDIDADGRKEIVLVSGSRIYAYYFNGALANYFPQPLGSGAATSLAIAPILADVDGDGRQELLAPGADGDVYSYRSNGRLVDGFPLAMAGPGSNSLATGDLDGDGTLELVGVSGNGFVHVWRLPQSAAADRQAWPMYHHDPAHSSLNSLRETPVVRTDGLLPTALVYNYPNPTEGDRTIIRYRLNGEARVKISIYDTAGDLVQELSGPGIAQAENEVTWNLSSVESGVYLARVEAQSGRETQTAFIKIAVVK